MNRPRVLWHVFLVSVSVMAGVMLWASRRMLEFERSEQRLAVQAESERLALWRLDSALLPLVTRESSRSPDAWMTSDATVVTAAELPPVRFRFQADADGQLRLPSPSSGGAPSVRESFQHQVSPEALALAVSRALSGSDVVPTENLQATQIVSNSGQFGELNQNAESQQLRNSREFQRRMNNTFLQNEGNFLSQTAINAGQRPMPRQVSEAASRATPTTAVWCADQLLLVRRVSRGSDEVVQGCWLDWTAMQSWLLEEVRDLLPEAKLEPVTTVSPSDEHLLLAALPARVVPGPAAALPLPSWTPLQLSLLAAWAWLTISAVAVGVLLLGVMRLSERRAAFVSAVTHELRTPLTTLQLYADLLGTTTGLPDEKRNRYIDTLRREAERLRHLVDNVLAWSRLERTTDANLLTECEWSELWQRCEPTLRRRAEQAGMMLVVEPSATSLRVCANPTAVEQVLFNLIDNACKYAAAGEDRRIHVEATSETAQVVIRVRDHGPGLPHSACSRLFEPFAKSATEAAQSAPGVGLGLSLCRRLARSQGGDVVLQDSSPNGTTFTLRLPRATPS